MLSVALGFALLGSAAYWATSNPATPTAYAEGSGAVTQITSSCPVDTISGSITVSGAVPAGTVTLEAFANTPGSGSDNFGDATGAIQAVAVGPVAAGDEASYGYALQIPTQFLGAPYNSLRVQVIGSSIAGLNGMTTKGPSLQCGGAAPTPTPTETPTPTPPSVVQIDFVCEGANGKICVDVQLTSAPATPITATLVLDQNGAAVATTKITLTGTDNDICFQVGAVAGGSYQVLLSSPSSPLGGKTASDSHTLAGGCVAPTPTPTPTPTDTPTPPSVVQIDFVCEGANGKVCVDVQLTSAPSTPITATLDLFQNGTDVATTTITLTGPDNNICFKVGAVTGDSYQVVLSSPSSRLGGKTVSDTHTLTGACLAPTPTPTPSDTPTPTPTGTPAPTPTPKTTPTPTSTPTGTPSPADTPTATITPKDAASPVAAQLAETGSFEYPLLLVGLAILGAGMILLGALVLRPRRR